MASWLLALMLRLLFAALLPAAHAVKVVGPGPILRGSMKDGVWPEPVLRGSVTDDRAEIEMCAMQEFDARQATLSPDARLVFIVHRKTGYILASRINQCINGVEGDHTAERSIGFPGLYDGKAPSKPALVHMVRDPLDWLLSEYLYDKITSTEKNTLREGTAERHKIRAQHGLHFMGLAKSPKGSESDFMEVEENESLRDYLVRVGPWQGMRATLAYSWRKMQNIAHVRELCLDMGSANCMQVYLNVPMSSSEAFNTTITRILKFSEIEPTQEMLNCIALQDTHSDAFANSDYAKHCSSQDVTAEQREYLRDLLVKLDNKFYNGIYQTLSEEWKSDWVSEIV